MNVVGHQNLCYRYHKLPLYETILFANVLNCLWLCKCVVNLLISSSLIPYFCSPSINVSFTLINIQIASVSACFET